ncbi:MAG: periplasmic protein TonB [Sphingomonadales bacterium]|jgi:protein TonB|nr:periplasmic protein TonB [Sphingomonadales bacterium]
MICKTILAALLAATAIAAIATPPASTPLTEAEQWAVVRRVNSVAAYETYLRRFPDGAHHDEAVEAFYRLQGRPVLYAPPPPPGPFAPPGPPARPLPDDACVTLLIERPDSREARAYLAARRDNRPSELRRFIAQHPGGACRPNMARLLAARDARRLQIRPIPGLGPLPPHRLTRQLLENDDYPAAAIRNNESGTVTAAWEVAEDGAAESCRIIRPSGSAALDEATCAAVARRMVYDPARDAAGNPIRANDRLTVVWRMPPDEPPPAPPAE